MNVQPLCTSALDVSQRNDYRAPASPLHLARTRSPRPYPALSSEALRGPSVALSAWSACLLSLSESTLAIPAFLPCMIYVGLPLIQYRAALLYILVLLFCRPGSMVISICLSTYLYTHMYVRRHIRRTQSRTSTVLRRLQERPCVMERKTQ